MHCRRASAHCVRGTPACGWTKPVGTLKPDISWWEGGRCTFVGDVKYKRLYSQQVAPNADLYQLLAYAIAADVPGGLLIYARGEREETTATVRHTGKRLEVRALDLSGTPEDILAQVNGLAARVAQMRAGTPALRPPLPAR
ncbi:MAG: hypothetical protein DCC58_20325 [Chloroflexi bacterium]|nr:MAG: hypothetical protein DCC58_20325 [Chloroflexota bacterium]